MLRLGNMLVAELMSRMEVDVEMRSCLSGRFFGCDKTYERISTANSEFQDATT